MILFLFTFLLLYGGMHFYAFMRVRSAFSLSAGTLWPLLIVLLFMALGPILVHYLESLGQDAAARLLAWVTFIWMGWILLFFSAALVLDFYSLLYAIIPTSIQSTVRLPHLGPLIKFIIPAFLALGLGLYGIIEARQLRVEKLSVTSPKLTELNQPLRLAQISDLHIGLMNREAFSNQVLSILDRLQPDLLVCTGDLLDGEVCRLDRIAQIWRQYNPPLGKYAVTGNHEYYAGIKQSLKCLREAGFTVLRSETAQVAELIELVGVDDPTGKSFGEKSMAESELLRNSSANSEKYTILLKHRPTIDPKSLGAFDLQLSGHTHKGQIFPFNLLTKIFYPKLAGYFPLGNSSALYVSRGTGSWGPPMRVFAPPEITLIELIPAP